jgi:hypothetical protein
MARNPRAGKTARTLGGTRILLRMEREGSHLVYVGRWPVRGLLQRSNVRRARVPEWYECHVCDKRGTATYSSPHYARIPGLPRGWGFVLDDDPYADRSICIGASAFYACENCKENGI